MSHLDPKLHGTEAVSPWVARWAHLVPQTGQVLDLACGHGRHARYFLDKNLAVAVVDISDLAIKYIANNISTEASKRAELIVADLENNPWPLPGRIFSAIVVTNYLWRPLLPTIVQSLAPGGVLLYETFAAGNETVGKPSRPDFLLQNGELLSVCASLRIVAYEDGFLPHPDRFVQRIVAVNDGQVADKATSRYSLTALDANG